MCVLACVGGRVSEPASGNYCNSMEISLAVCIADVSLRCAARVRRRVGEQYLLSCSFLFVCMGMWMFARFVNLGGTMNEPGRTLIRLIFSRCVRCHCVDVCCACLWSCRGGWAGQRMNAFTRFLAACTLMNVCRFACMCARNGGRGRAAREFLLPFLALSA